MTNMRTYEEILYSLNVVEQIIEPIRQQYYEGCKVIDNLNKELEECILANKMYRPMSDLKKYTGRKDLSSIDLVLQNDDGSVEIEDMCNDEFFEVDKDGHLHYSSFMYGVMDFNKERNVYEYAYHGHFEDKNFIGFLNIKFYNED